MPKISLRPALAAVILLAGTLPMMPAFASDAEYEAALADVRATFGTVPQFISGFPKAALPGAWAELKALLLSNDTVLDAKTKALIAVGVSAAIHCASCQWMDSADALRNGATEEELHEAIGIAALEQHWATVIAGLQIDLSTMKTDLGSEGE